MTVGSWNTSTPTMRARWATPTVPRPSASAATRPATAVPCPESRAFRRRIVADTGDGDVPAGGVVAVEVGMAVVDAVVPDADGHAGSAVVGPGGADGEIDAGRISEVPLPGEQRIVRQPPRLDRLRTRSAVPCHHRTTPT